MELEREKAVIIAVKRPEEAIDIDELKGLIEALNGEVVQTVVQKRRKFSPSTYVGKGKVLEIDADSASLIVAYHPLSYSQKRNLEALTGLPVIDRTEVILEIFARRAKTKEAKIQVELAKLYYRLSHLRGKGKKLSRLGGGVGTRGPGETKLEVEARMVKRRVHKLRRELDEIVKRQKLFRAGREKRGLVTVAVVGYTNVGKSTIVKALTSKDVFVRDMPFATLDVRTGMMFVNGKKILVSDTVGFIRDLPHELIASFRATLSEVEEADLLLVVFDASSGEAEEEIRSVMEVLKRVGAWDKPKIFVGNKIDRVLSSEGRIAEIFPMITAELKGDSLLVYVSAKKGWGMDKLRTLIIRELFSTP